MAGNFSTAVAYKPDPTIIAYVTTNWTDFLKCYTGYLEKQGKLEYETASFQWFRPKDLKEKITPKSIACPFKTDQIDQFVGQITPTGLDDVKGTTGDYGLISTQKDYVVAANRAYSQRQRAKLRYYAHTVGVHAKLASSEGVFQHGMNDFLTEIQTRAKQ
jgi:hypothetical protein